MRVLKLSLAALAMIGVVAVVGVRVAGERADGATPSASSPAIMAMPAPAVFAVIQRPIGTNDRIAKKTMSASTPPPMTTS